ncbi:hypothetical protein Tco_0890849 [Tanacetum coccineum]|uniref:Uncharacterized protein n=1 Tax=Tanacetum coccineum TaxID=301880 RepID=A0ABQ5C484_9ASTR
MEESLRKFLAESAKRHEENSNLIKEIRASMDAAIRNQGASIKALEIQIGQMSKFNTSSTDSQMHNNIMAAGPQKSFHQSWTRKIFHNGDHDFYVQAVAASEDNYYQAPKPQRSNATSSSTRPSASTRHKGKEIAKPVTPQSESVFEEDSDPEQAQRDKDMQKNLALLAKYFKEALQTNQQQPLNCSKYCSRNKTEDTTPMITTTNIQRQKPKRVKDYSYHKEKMMMCKQAKQGVPLQAEQDDWLADTDEEIDEQELEAHYSFMAKIQEVLPGESSSTKQPLEQVQNHDEDNVFANERRHSENNTAECADERAALANLIANFTLDTEENKMILKQLKKANASLPQETRGLQN